MGALKPNPDQLDPVKLQRPDFKKADFTDNDINRVFDQIKSSPKKSAKELAIYILELPMKPVIFLIDWFKVTEPRWKTTLALVLLVSIVSSLFLYSGNISQAASFTYTQTSWGGGLDSGTGVHPTNQSNWDKYSAQSNIDFGTAGSLKSSSSDSSLLDLTNGLKAYWKMDEGTGSTVADSSGSGNTGTLDTTSSRTSWTTGKISNGAHVITTGGITGSITSSSDSLDDLQNSSGMSISLWFYTTVDGVQIIGKNSASCAGVGSWVLNYIGVSNRIRFVKDGSTDLQASFDNTSVIGSWVHLVLTWDGTTNSSGLNLYKNGVLQSRTSGINGVSLTSDASCSQSLGTASLTAGNYVEYDEFRAYNRIINQQEVSRIYDSSSNDFSTTETFGTTLNRDGATTSPLSAWSGDGQVSAGTIQSTTLDNYSGTIGNANISRTETLAGGTATYYLSADGGSNFEQVTPGSNYVFTNTGSDLRLKIVLTGSATVQDITITYSTFNASSNLTGNAYNSTDAGNLVTKLAWTATGTTGARTVQFQIRSAPDSSGSPGTWSSWCGYDDCSGTNYFDSADNNVSVASNHPLRSGADDQWFQYKVFFSTDGGGTPSLDDLTITYVVNVAPNFDTDYPSASAGGASAAQVSDSSDPDYGKVLINYRIRDIDTDTGTVTPGFVTPTMQYNIGGGWVSITAGYLASTNLDNKAVDDSNYTTYTATWNAKTQIPTNYLTTAQVRVSVSDNEAANFSATATSANFTLDTTNPSVSAFTMNSSTDKLTLAATDATNLSYKLSNNSDMTADGVNGTSGTWVAAGGNSISINPDWVFAGSPNEQVYYQVRDAYGNVSSGSAKAPATITSMDIKDISNEEAENFREFVSWGVYSSVAGATFVSYKVYRSTDNSSFSLIATISDINLNYVADPGLDPAEQYYYKVLVLDSDGDIGNYSDVVSDVPNGQGGTDTTAPSITNVTVAETQATYARITWTTDELSDSRVDYSISPSTAFGSGSSVSSYVTSHSVTVTGLNPDTTYLFRVKSTDAVGNQGMENNSGDGFTFTTSAGPVISGVTETNVNATTATIFWNTNVDSDSHVTYSTSEDLTSSTTLGSNALVGGSAPFQHSVDITGLVAGTTYYYYVSSEDGSNNESINNNGGNYYSFVTTTDTVPPVITDIATPVIAPTAAVVIWTTDELATTQLQWGSTSGSLDQTTTLDSTLTIYHVVSLSDLEEANTYFYRAVSEDLAGNSTTSDEEEFTTGETTIIEQVTVVSGGGGGGGQLVDPNPEPDETPPVISKVEQNGVASFSGNISFETDEDTVGFVQYGKEEDSLTSTAGEAEYDKEHNVGLKGLVMGTEYHYQVKAVDKGGNVTTSDKGKFTTEFFTESSISIDNVEQFQQEVEDAIESALPSLVPPFIERPLVSDITDETATITWRTNIKTFSVVKIASEDEYKPDSEDPFPTDISDTENKVNNHEIKLLNLKPNTRYHIVAESFSLPRLIGKSKEITFVTKALPVQARVIDVRNTSFKVIWSTGDPTTSVVSYRNLKTNEGQQKQSDEHTRQHEILVDNLTPATAYEIGVFGYNEKGNKIETIDNIRVTTSVDVINPIISGLKIDSALIPGRNDRTQTIVSWRTDEPGSSTVYYEEGSGGGAGKALANKVELTDNYVTDHAVVISILKPGGIYRIQVASTDQAGNLTTFPIRTVVIPRQAESIMDIIFKNFEDTFKFLRQ